MTVLYSAAAAGALICAVQPAFQALRDRSLTLVTFALSMAVLSASLAVVAASPAVLHAGASGPALWASSGLGVIATWAFAGALSAANACYLRFADMVVTPVLGGAALFLLLLGMQIAEGSGAHQTARPGVAVIGTQLRWSPTTGLHCRGSPVLHGGGRAQSASVTPARGCGRSPRPPAQGLS